MTRRRMGIIAGGIALALLVLVVGVAASGGDGGADASGDQAASATAPVVRADLVSRRVIDGTLGYHEVDGGLVVRAAGRVTGLEPEGTIVPPGRPLYELDGAPVLLLAGDGPITRDLVLGTRGSDVAQVNATFGVEGEVFTTATAEALRAAQEAAGGTPTGILRPSHAVVLPGAVRVGSHVVVDGADVESGDEIAALTIDELVVVVELDAGERDTVAAGDEVAIELPSGDDVPGTIRSVASVADDGEEEGDPQTVEVVITLADPAAADGFTGAAVDVSITEETAENVLAVPVTALVALAEGGYGVEVVGAGHNRLVGVEIGMFSDADDLVEVTGDLREGDEVVVPA